MLSWVKLPRQGCGRAAQHHNLLHVHLPPHMLPSLETNQLPAARLSSTRSRLFTRFRMSSGIGIAKHIH